ncbi:MAG: ABC transporter permease [Actinomycetes bacterium]|jgi:ABC-2 type transport system permease protein|nr:ABC transporter permease [Acidimicrobiia bacterium]
MKVVQIGLVGLRRMLRDRSNIFFVFIFPLVIILLVGAQFGSGSGPSVVVSHDGGPLVEAIVERMADSVVFREVESESEVVDAVERGAASAGIVFPDGFDDAISEGRASQIGFVRRPDEPGALQPILEAAVAEVTADHRVAAIVARSTGAEFTEALEDVAPVRAAGVEVQTERVGEELFPDAGQFDVGAAGMLVMFVFLTALTGSAVLIQNRQLGITHRMLSTPTPTATVIAGEGMARFLVGLFQGVYIVVFSLILFRVDWGDPLGWILVLVPLAAVGAGAAMLLGTLFRNPEQAAGISVISSIGLAALGGCMLPLELFSPGLRTIAHVTPHAWALDGFADLTYRGGSVADVLPEVGVLCLYAGGLILLASWRLRAVIRA